MEPIIGVSASMEMEELNYKVSRTNIKAIEQNGGIPVILPHYPDEITINTVAEKLDGLYLTGGYDIDPTLFGEEPHPELGTIIPTRDPFEVAMIHKMLDKDKPILAVCRGIQILNIALGGDMYQDIYSQVDRPLLQHSQNAPSSYGSHFVEITSDSMLHQLIGRGRIRVNSHHHQANRSVKAPLKICATSSDFVIEAIESTKHHFALGLQWHPENMLTNDGCPSEQIYHGFIQACK